MFGATKLIQFGFDSAIKGGSKKKQNNNVANSDFPTAKLLEKIKPAAKVVVDNVCKNKDVKDVVKAITETESKLLLKIYAY